MTDRNDTAELHERESVTPAPAPAPEQPPENLSRQTWVTLILFAALVVVGSGCMTGLLFG